MAEKLRQRPVETVLRFAERTVPFTRDGAKERRKYERRVHALLEPDNSAIYQQEIQYIKGLVDSVAPHDSRPALEEFESLSLVPDLFRNPNQVINSDHNYPHMIITATLSMLRSRQLIAGRLMSPTDINEKALWIGSLLHDTQRRGDVVESVPPLLRRHGKDGSERADELMQKMGIPDTERLHMLPTVQQMIRYHDSRSGMNKPASKELEILEFTDRMALGRLFESHHAFVRLTAGEIVAKRMRRYHEKDATTRDPLVTPADVAIYSQIAGAMDTLVKKRIQQKGLTQPEDVAKATLQIATELGLFRSSKEGETDPHVVSASGHTLPTAA